MRLQAVTFFFTLLLTSGVAAPAPATTAPLHHALLVSVDPASHTIAVDDAITSSDGADLPDLPEDALPFDVAHVSRPDAKTIRLRYLATIDHPISREGEDYARGFAETDGTIQPEGVFLGETSRWYAHFDDDRLVTFDLEILLPAGWDAISQGKRTIHEATGSGMRVRFSCDDPQEEIWLVAGPWVETSREVEGVSALTMLRAKDDALAAKYLDATGPYVAMYAKLLGPYPYPKFALVENFWETGYGMPSFTLLGPQVIRLPFIITTSYPHEILHNWWGNGVYVDPSLGNWSEGLTAYLADHLFAEQKGGGAAYRQEALQKYADYAARSKDFPLASFTERHSASTEAVGYGKSLMLFHMMRRELGDETFVNGLRAFYKENRFRRASFDDLRRAFEAAAGRNLAPAFTPWVTRTGAARVIARDVRATGSGSTWRLSGELVQAQSGPPYPLSVPLAVTLEGKDAALQTVVHAEAETTAFTLDLPARPLRLDVDPEFDLFRALDREESPPALSGAFGADKAFVILPSKAPADLLDAYRGLAAEWNHGRPTPMRVVLDVDVRKLPDDEAIWVVGFENRFLDAAAKPMAVYGASVSPAGMKIAAEETPRNDHAIAVAVRRADHPDLALAVVAADHAAQVAGLARKLPHYHKYSYLAFSGDEPTNTVKGRWSVVASPMTVFLDPDRKPSETPMGSLAARAALAELPPAFSREKMMATVRALSAPELGGRGLGTPEIEKATSAIADAMRAAGLAPAGDEGGSYFQRGTGSFDGKALPLVNVVGMLRGTKSDVLKEWVVVGAHYDHLGTGGSLARSGNAGKVHPGADDNASGVAVLLELARQMAAAGPSPRTIVFAAFSGEEEGLLGSKLFVARGSAAGPALAMVNLDTVGRLGKGSILALGSGSADEWIHIVNGAGYVTGGQVKAVMTDPGGSDQKSFLDAGVPAVQLFTGANADYHTPGDTADKIDADGLVSVAAVTREIVAYLAERDRPLTSHAGAGSAMAVAPAATSAAHRASLGGVPDYGASGPGVRLNGVTPGSPAEKAGLREGDVIVGIGDRGIETLQDYASALKAKAPGDVVTVRFRRDGKESSVEVALGER